AAYSGLTQEDYDTLSEVAPVVAHPATAWGTSGGDMDELDSAGLGRAEEGAAVVAEAGEDSADAGGAAPPRAGASGMSPLPGPGEETADGAAAAPQLAGTSAMFLTHVDTTDLSEVSFYTTHDTRAMFFEDLGLTVPPSVAELSAQTDRFALTHSAEQADAFDDVDLIVTYGGEELVAALEADPLLSQMPAVANGAIVSLPGDGPLGTAANPTPLSISWVLEDYVALLAQAADAGA